MTTKTDQQLIDLLKQIVTYGLKTRPATTSVSVSMASITDTTFTSLATGEYLRYNGSVWVNSGLVAGDIDFSAITTTTLATGDKILFLDVSDSDNMKYTTAQTIADLTPTLTQEEVEDYAGSLIATGGTKTGISITYQDATGDMDFVVSDTTVAGDSGSTGITPGDTLTIAGGTNVTTSMSGDTLTINATDTGDSWGDVVDADIVPDADGTRDLGTTLVRFAETYTDALDVTNNITVGGTVDGRDIATDGTKLDGIESGATGDQTAEEIQDAAWGGTTLSGTQTGITVTYQDSTNDVDFVVSDTTVAGDTGSTGITPGDTLTIAGGTEITTSMSGDTLTINADFTPSSTDTITNKTINTASNTITINEADISDLGAYIENVSEDTTPQLGGSLDVNGNKIVSTANGNIDIEPNGTGNVLLGNFTFDADQTVGAGQDNYVLTYDNASGTIGLEASAGGGLSDVVDDTTPQLGGNLDVNGNKITSASNGDIDIEPNGTGNVLLGNFEFDADQTVGAGQDNYVLTYDNGTGHISLEAATGGGSGVAWTEVTSATASSDATLEFTGLTGYDEYLFQIEDLLPVNDGVGLRIRFSTDNGSTWISTSTYYSIATGGVGVVATPSINSRLTTAIAPQTIAQGNQSGEIMDGTVLLRRNVEGSEYPEVTGAIYNQDTTGGQSGGLFNGLSIGVGASDVDAVQFYYNSGNIASGTIRVFGR